MFRDNVAALVQCQGQFVACYRASHSTWQCVQGGIEPSDISPIHAIEREMQEELGIQSHQFKIIYQSKFWRRYFFTPQILKSARFKDNIGQEQLWFLIEISQFSDICLEKSEGEFQKVELVDIDQLVSSYSQWKKAAFFDFCREVGLLQSK